MQQVKVVVLWQSLVVESYRSFFYQLHRLTGWPITLIAPRQFRELGDQVIDCAPFEPSPNNGVVGVQLGVLRPHLQAVVFRGLRRVLSRSFRDAADTKIFLCLAESYSFTALYAWIVARLTIGHRFLFLTFAAQNIDKPLSWPIRAGLRFVLRRSDAVLTVGVEQERLLRHQGFRGRCIRFPLWFHSRLFERDRLEADVERHFTSRVDIPLLRSRVVIGYCGRMRVEKGVFDLLDTVETCLSDLRDDLVIVLAGAGRELARAKSRCRHLQEAGWQVVHLGPLPAEQVPALMHLIDILAVPSRTTPNWKEQFGRVIVEAMAAGAEVIGSDSGEIPNVIGDAAMVFPEGNLEAMAALLRRRVETLRDPVTRTMRRGEMRDKALQRYSDIALARNFAEALQFLLPG